MERDDLRAFAHRNWAAAERSKQQYWVERFRRDGPGPARHASTLLLEHARRLGSVLLNGPDRAGDLAHHIALRNRLDRAGRALARR
jgi:hypothetical protein